MLVNPFAAPVPTPVEAGARVVAAVAATARVARVDGDAGRQRQEPDTAPAAPAADDRAALQAAADALNQHFQLRHAELHFSVDELTDRLVVTMTDSRDGTVIRQLPSVEALRMAQALHEAQARKLGEVALPPLIRQTA